MIERTRIQALAGATSTRVLSYLLVLGVALACYRFMLDIYPLLTKALGAIALLIGLILLPSCFKTLRWPGPEHASAADAPPVLSHTERWYLLIFNQLLIGLGGGIFFFALVLQTQISPKLNAVHFTPIYNLLTQDSVYIGFLPWVLLSALAVLVNLYSTNRGHSIWLPRLLLPKVTYPHPQKFIKSCFNDVLHASITICGVLLLCYGVFLLCQGLSTWFGIAPIWTAPIRNGLFILIIVTFSYKKRNALIKKYVKRGFSLGSLFVLTAVLITVGLIGFELLINFSETPIQEYTLFKELYQYPTSDSASERCFGTLMTLWWLLWIPHLVACLSRFAQGLKVWQAFLYPLLLPAIVFLWITPNYLTAEDFASIVLQLQQPGALIGLGIVALNLVYLLFQHVHRHFDLHLGLMPQVALTHKNYGLFLVSRPLIKGFLSWLALTSISGWVAVQMILSVAGCLLVVLLGATVLAVLGREVLGGIGVRWGRA